MIKSLFLIFSFFCFQAQAEIYFKPGVMYIQDKETVNGSDTTTTRQLLDVTVLFGFNGNNWVLGGIYNSENKKTESSGTPTEEKRTNMGLSGGWLTDKDFGPYVLADYYVSCSMSVGTTTYTGNMCYQLDLGLKATVRSAGFGAQLSYKKFSYNKSNIAAIDPPNESTMIDPYFVVFFKF